MAARRTPRAINDEVGALWAFLKNQRGLPPDAAVETMLNAFLAIDLAIADEPDLRPAVRSWLLQGLGALMRSLESGSHNLLACEPASTHLPS